MQHFLSVKDADSIESLLAQALYYKNNPFADQALGKGKRLGCLFLNPSMRTRLSTQIAAQSLMWGQRVGPWNLKREPS
jgi:N-succinyl-L-ornithine transcarbamylase